MCVKDRTPKSERHGQTEWEMLSGVKFGKGKRAWGYSEHHMMTTRNTIGGRLRALCDCLIISQRAEGLNLSACRVTYLKLYKPLVQYFLGNGQRCPFTHSHTDNSCQFQNDWMIWKPFININLFRQKLWLLLVGMTHGVKYPLSYVLWKQIWLFFGNHVI